MQFSKIHLSVNKDLSILDFIKIAIIVITSFYLLANFIPFYDGNDTLVYAVSAISLATTGTYEVTNDLMQEAGGMPFIPRQWVNTVHDTAIPIGSSGIYGLATIAYILGGNYGLFYLGPIFAVLLLIFSERIATKLFGSLAGLVTLVLVATDAMIFLNGRWLLTDTIFTVFFILGCFYLIRFLQQKRDSLILFSSIFFAISTFFRINGVIFFPFEILIVVGYFSFQKIKQKKDLNTKSINKSSSLLFLQTKSKKLFKIGIFLLIPWLVYFLFFFSFNAYFFGDPLTSYQEQLAECKCGKDNLPEKDEIVSNLFKFNSDRFEWIKYDSVPLLPDTVQSFLLNISTYDIIHFF